MDLRENDLVIDATGFPWRIDVEDDPELFPVPTLWAWSVFEAEPNISHGRNVASLAQPVVLIYRNGEPQDRIVGWS